jgi:hypothetical protein
MRSVLAGGGTTAPAGTAATPNAGPRSGGRGKGKSLAFAHGDVVYLWILLGLELTLTYALRAWSRDHHGG